MTSTSDVDSSVVDVLDRQLIHTLQVAPRAPFSALAHVLDVSEQTAARRYRRLLADGMVRVVGLVDRYALGRTAWLIRMQCRPDGAAALAAALARRPDVSYVTLTSGGSELGCISLPRTDRQRDELLLQRLPRMAQVLTMTAQAVLHEFTGPDAEWTDLGGRLPPARLARLEALTKAGAQGEPTTVGSKKAGPALSAPLGPEDQPLLDALAIDGRAGYEQLARATGWPAGRAARRTAELLRCGLLHLDVEVAVEMLGFAAQAFLWLTVPPSELDDAGRAVSVLPQVAFCAAVTGPTNLVASVVCHDSADLYQFVTAQIGAVRSVRQVEISPTLRRVKQAGTLMAGPRLALPVSTSGTA